MDLEVTVVGEGPASIARVTGEIDLMSAPTFQERLLGAAAETDALVVDLTDVSYLDSSALASLHRVLLSCRDRGTELRVVTGTEGVSKRLLGITGLDEVMRASDTVAEALATLTTVTEN